MHHPRALFTKKGRSMTPGGKLPRSRLSCFSLECFDIVSSNILCIVLSEHDPPKNLSEWNRISTKLFRRSESRLLALAEAIWVKKERWNIFLILEVQFCCRREQRVNSYKRFYWSSSTGCFEFTACLDVVLYGTVLYHTNPAEIAELWKVTHGRNLSNNFHRHLIFQAWNRWKRADNFMEKHPVVTAASI